MEYFNPWDYSALYIKDEIWSYGEDISSEQLQRKKCA